MALIVENPSETAQKYLQEHVKTLVRMSAIFSFINIFIYYSRRRNFPLDLTFVVVGF